MEICLSATTSGSRTIRPVTKVRAVLVGEFLAQFMTILSIKVPMGRCRRWISILTAYRPPQSGAQSGAILRGTLLGPATQLAQASRMGLVTSELFLKMVPPEGAAETGIKKHRCVLTSIFLSAPSVSVPGLQIGEEIFFLLRPQ